MASKTPSSSSLTLPVRLQPLVVSAALLQRFESGLQAAAPAQYRALVQQVQRQLADTPADAALDALLRAFPVLTELYENQHYAHAGLCRHELEASLNAELAASDAVQRARAH